MFAFLFFCLAIATAVYGGRFGNWEQEFNDSDVEGDLPGDAADLNDDLGAVAVSTYSTNIKNVCRFYRDLTCLPLRKAPQGRVENMQQSSATPKNQFRDRVVKDLTRHEHGNITD